MNVRFLLLLGCCACVSNLFAQVHFSKKTNLLTPQEHFTGGPVSVLDMDGDGHDDIVRLDQGYQLNIAYQTAPNAPFLSKKLPDVSDAEQWGMCAADVDNNGFPDVLTGGFYDGIKVVRANADGSAYQLEILDKPGTFTQGANFADINNDGWLDAFICHDDGPSRIFLNNGAGGLVYAPQTIDLSTLPASDDSGNYGSVWSDIDNDGDLDLYIAKCRQDVNDPTDGRRINQLFLNDGVGSFTQDLSNASGLRIGAQSWTADFGDIDNDGDFDCFITNHDVSSQLLENDGAGHFTDISAAAGLDNTISFLPIQAVFRDFDNDGFIDLLVSGSDHMLFRNRGDKTFEPVDILDDQLMLTFALGDLNADGFQDIYAGYGQIFVDPSGIPDELWLNDGNNNHFFGLNLRGVQSNRNAVGAKILLYTAAGLQVREVRSGESYGIMNSLQVQFGLGALTQIDSVQVRWPSGITDVLVAPAVDQYLTLQEGGCQIPAVRIALAGEALFCSGDSVQLSAPEGYTYLWNTGSTAQTIFAQTAGHYEVQVTAPGGCSAVSNTVSVSVDPVEIPIISFVGDTVFCAGSPFTLTASPAAAYQWSTGDTTASIEVTESGVYSVTTQGLCAAFTSAPLTLTVLEAPLPAPAPDTVLVNTAAQLSASGEQLIWYDSAVGGQVLATGPVFETPVLTENTTYWVSNTMVFDQPNQFTGMTDHMGSNFASVQTNGSIIFNCLSPFTLNSAKVYTNKAGVRKILLNSSLGVLLDSVSLFIPQGESRLNLNLKVPVGKNLSLTTDPLVNQASIATNGPQLRRSDEGIQYPYDIPKYLSIKSSNFGTDRYYYFYDWEVDFPGSTCESARVPVTAVVDTVTIGAPSLAWAAQVRVSPNPALDQVWVDWPGYAGGELVVSMKDGLGRTVSRQVLDAPAGALRFTVPCAALPAGAYWLELKNAAGLVSKKIVRQ
ncbi:MAG: CRTAC1 family protein [Saprospiraceae bacterium]|nr:CRTAC1 family protein [Saprospiraceae bacterium]